MRRFVIVVSVLMATLVVSSAAQAEIPQVFTGKGDITCTVQGPGESEGQRWCGTGTSTEVSRSTAKTFDDMPIDVNVAFPKAPATGPDGPYPLMMIFHGYALSKATFTTMQRWLDRGYAVFSMTDRGFHESCGTETSRLADPTGCADGFLRLLDTRYEVRDAQVFAGMLADENLIIPDRIAATGGSYGGGLAMALSALKDRTMMPDGSLVPWKSPDGKAMKLSVAIPSIPWTDLAYSLVPNGGTLDYVKDNSYYGRFGVMKESWVNVLYSLGLSLGEGNYSLPGQSPSADLTGWLSLLSAGEPYDGNPEAEAILDDIKTNHSSYYIDHSEAPAPTLIYSGFTDDLFPVDEALRFYNRTRAQYPDTPVGLTFGPNSGHMRGMAKEDVAAAQVEIENTWVDHYLKDVGPAPAPDVNAFLQTCPEEAPAGEPFTAKDWPSMAPGEIRITDPGQTKTIAADSGDPLTGGIYNPAPTGAACNEAPGGEEPGTANWELPPAPPAGYTILGAPTVVAGFKAGDTSQVAARLVDVSPDGATKILIARALWRPAADGPQVFQLHANAYKVREGHVARLELLAKDASVPAGGIFNYGRPSNGQEPVDVSDLDLRVPVAEKPGSLGDLVTEPAAKVLPDRPGVELAPGYEPKNVVPIDEYEKGRLTVVGVLKAKGNKLKIQVRCGKSVTCAKTALTVKGAVKGRKAKGKNIRIAAVRGIKLATGKSKVISVKLTRGARKLLGSRKRNGLGLKRVRTKVTISTAGLKKRTVIRTVKRSGPVR